MQSESILLV